MRAWLPRLFLAVLMVSALPAVAQDRVTLGVGRMFTNDALADGHDRWRSGSYMIGVLRGPAWHGRLPARMGAVLEYRLRAEVVTAARIARPAPGDRRHAGILSLGLHSHFALGRGDARIGADLVLTGPQTGVAAFQRAAHDLLGLSRPDLSDQIGNAAHAMLSAEIGRDIDLSRHARLRPFAEAQVGFETLLRLGADLTLGPHGQGALMLRDPVTGHRFAGIRARDAARGLSLMIGADTAIVTDSALLPDGGAAVLNRHRHRVRAGVHALGRRGETFYGVTWLSEEFAGQGGGQLVGSLQLRLRF